MKSPGYFARRVLPTLALALIYGAAPPVGAQKLDASIAIGHSERVWSEVLGEERRILVYTPSHYERSVRRYPVLYLLDGEMHFHHATGVVQFLSSPDNGRIPEMIVVAVTNTVRPRDLTPPTTDASELARLPGSGHADAFLDFLSRELIPRVDERYRTEPFRILVGHSLGGLFGMHALLSKPDSFQAFIIVSPALQWNHRATLSRAMRELSRLSAPHFLFLSWGDNEPTMRAPTSELADWLAKNPLSAIRWGHRYYAGEEHNSTPHLTLYDGLMTLYSDWRLPLEKDDVPIEYEMADVEAHYAALSRRLGYAVKPSREIIDSVARARLKRGDAAGALRLLKRNAREHSDDFRAHKSLADALEQAGCIEQAVEENQRALRLATEAEYQNGRAAVEYARTFERLRLSAETTARTHSAATCSRSHDDNGDARTDSPKTPGA